TDLLQQPAVQTGSQSFADLVFDKHSSCDIGNGHVRDLTSRFRALFLISRASDLQVSLFEFVGKRERLDYIRAFHPLSDPRRGLIQRAALSGPPRLLVSIYLSGTCHSP